jgi:hypothetical protein
MVSRAAPRTHTPLAFCRTGAWQPIEICITGEFASRILTMGYTSFCGLSTPGITRTFMGY